MTVLANVGSNGAAPHHAYYIRAAECAEEAKAATKRKAQS
jgi:hypothetical protein